MKELAYHLAVDTIDKKDIDALIRWLKTGPRLTKGELTLEFEKKWATRFGRKYGVFCNSGSSALLLMWYALVLSGRLVNKKVIVPSCGWVTTVAPAIQFGLEPIMCGADPETFGIDLDELEVLLKKHHPAAVAFVQVLGVPHAMDRLMALKKKYNFIMLEDCCAALGSAHKGKMCGSFGDMVSFSFYFGHQLSTIEGGMVMTDDLDLRDLLLMARSHGWDKDLSPVRRTALQREHGLDSFAAPFFFYEPGFNLRPTDLQAFIGLGQLKKLERVSARRHANHALYKKLLGDYFYTQTYNEKDVVASIHFVAIAKDGVERRRVVEALMKNGIETRLYTAGNLGRHPFWTKRYGVFVSPVSDRLYECGFFLPNHPSLSLKDVRFIAGVVLEAVGV